MSLIQSSSHHVAANKLSCIIILKRLDSLHNKTLSQKKTETIPTNCSTGFTLKFSIITEVAMPHPLCQTCENCLFAMMGRKFLSTPAVADVSFRKNHD